MPRPRWSSAHPGPHKRHGVERHFLGQDHTQDGAEAARFQWRSVADQLGPKVPNLAALSNEAESNVLAYMGCPARHRVKLRSTKPLERLNGEIKLQPELDGIFSNEAALTRLFGAILLERNHE